MEAKEHHQMRASDWAELWQLNEQAKVALMMGQLDQMQMADAMAFHTLSHFILDLNERVKTITQLMDSSTLASDQSGFSRIVVEK